MGRSLDSERQPSPTRAPRTVAKASASEEGAALTRVQEHFPEFFEADPGLAKAEPLNAEAALHVTPPATEGEALELTTRGYVFQVRTPRAGSQAAAKRTTADGAWYGPGHLWAPVGGKREAREGRWVTHRVEEYFVLPEGKRQHLARYEVTVPDGIVSVRDAHDYLEFLDAQERPVLRMHHVVARDGQGRTRQGPALLHGVVAVAGGGGQLARYALTGRTLSVRMELDLEGLTGPVVVDPGWSSTGTPAIRRLNNTMTLLPSGKVLITGGLGGGEYRSSAELYDPSWGGWSAAGAMHTRRSSHTAILLPSGKVLLAGGDTSGGTFPGEDLYDPSTGTWSITGRMLYSRDSHTATLLPSGKVLVVGGRMFNGSASMSTAELYDPATGTWSFTGTMPSSHYLHVAVLLPDGRVLVVGGHDASYVATTSASLYDPAANTWAVTGRALTLRQSASGTLLPNGKVLLAGGFSPQGAPHSSAELYDPVAGTWTLTGSMTSPRAMPATVLLSNGRVLMASGAGAGNLPTDTSELYDFTSGTWTESSRMVQSRQSAQGTLLADGRVLVLRGNAPDANAEVYEPVTAVRELAGVLGTARTGATATLLPNGDVLSMGGRTVSGEYAFAEAFTPSTGTSVSTGSVSTLRGGHTATLLLDGQVLVAGGIRSDGTTLALAERFQSAVVYSSTGAMTVARALHTATRLADGRVLVAGGVGSTGRLASAELYDPVAGTWRPTGAMGAPRYSHLSMLLPSGKVLVVGGGVGSTGALASAELYDPATETWTSTGSLATARVGHAGTVLTNGQVLVVGGRDGAGTFLASAERYDPVSGTWSSAGNMPVARDLTTATLLLSGNVLVAGGRQDAGGNSLASLELYVPATNSWTTSPVRLTTPRYGHTATLLPSGKVLLLGGTSGSFIPTPTSSAEYFNPEGARDSWRPSVLLPTFIGRGAAFTVSGARLRGISEGSHGHYGSSPTDFPMAQLMPVGGGAITRLSTTHFSGTSLSAVAPMLPAGHYLLSVTVGGITGGRVVGLDTGTVQAQGQSVTTAEDTSVAVTLSAQSSEGWPITWSVQTPPSRGTLSGTAPQLTYKPAANFFGSDSFVYQASDGVSSALATVSLTVTPVNDAPVASAVSVSAVVGTPVAVKLSATDPDGDALTYQVKVGPARGTLSGTAPNLTYTPQAGYTGPDTFTYTARDGTLESNVATVMLSINSAPIQATAVYDSTLKVPRCATPAASCDSASLLNGRAQLGPELNQPNTLGGTCADGTGGSYHSAESLDRLKVSTLDGQPFVGNKVVKIEAAVWVWSDVQGDWLDLYYSASATNPVWVFIGTLTPGASGAQLLSTTYTLPSQAGSQAIRGRFRYGGSASGPCVSGSYNDHDDLVFTVSLPPDLTPPTASLASPLPGAVLRDFASITATATDNVGVTKVELYDGAALLGTDTFAPYAFSWNTRTTTNGPHTLSLRAYDAAGNVGTAEVTVTIDNDETQPQVSIAAPLAGATVRGNVALTASASDNVGVTRLEFYAGSRLVGTASNTTSSTVWWSTGAEPNGTYTLRVLAHDARNNVGEASVVVTVDNELVPPTIAFTSPADGATVSGTLRLTVNASDNVAVALVVYEVDGKGVGSTSRPPFLLGWNSKLVPDGFHSVTATAFDTSGNASAPASRTLFVDNGGAASQASRAGHGGR